MDSFMEKVIADLVKGAERNSRDQGGPGVTVVVDRENHGREEKLARLTSMFDGERARGIKTAAARFGIKEAFLGALLPLAASLAGPTVARMGLGRLAGMGGSKALGGLLGRAAPYAQKLQGMTGKGLGGMAFDTAAGMAAGGLANRMMGGSQPQQPGQPQRPYSPMAAGLGGLMGGQIYRPPLEGA